MEGQINLFENSKYKNPMLIKLERELQELEERYRGKKLFFVLGVDLFAEYREAENKDQLGSYLKPFYNFDIGGFEIKLKCKDGLWRNYSYLVDDSLTYELQAVRIMQERNLEE